jgi:hypothetical protein
MDNTERVARYTGQLARTGQGRGVQVTLTPGQRRRLKHKENCRKTHSHEGRPAYEDGNGHFARLPCTVCQPAPRIAPRVGGIR